MKKYDTYKDSGIEWIGEIPSHWEKYRLGVIGKFTSSGIDKKLVDDEPEVKIINYTDIYGNGTSILDSSIDFMVVTTPQSKIDEHSVKKGDLIFTPSSETKEDIGLSAVVIEDLENTAFSYHVLRFQFDRNVDLNFKKYLCNNHFVLNHFSRNSQGTTRQTLGRNDFKNAEIILPPLKEQTAIAAYLDTKTAEIDELIADKKRLLELYEEEKTAIINQAVTKGLNHDDEGWEDYHDLDNPKEIKPSGKSKKSRFRQSGIEWLGDIPAHWEVKRFRHCITTLTDFTANGSFASLASNVNYLSSGYSRLVRLTDLRVNLSNEGIFVDEHAHNFLSKSELFGGEILLANVGAYAGLVIQMPYFEGKFTLGPNMFLIRVNQNSDYLNFMLNSAPVNSNLRNIALSSAQPKLNKDDIKGLRLVLPPIHEQDLIVNWLKTECARIDAKKAKTEKLIDLLTEYRTALISEVVTGKVKVV